MKKILAVCVCVLLLAGCYEYHSDGTAPYERTAKYVVKVHGPYNSWNGGESWTYYCDSYSYDGTEHYILKDASGTVLMDFTKRTGDRVEIEPNR